MSEHDQLFKNLLESFLPDLLALVVPELARRVEPSSLQFLRGEHFLDPPEGSVLYVDLLAELRLRYTRRTSHPRKNRGRCLVHVEIERRWSATMARRMWRYSQAIRRRRSQPLYSLVIYLQGGEGCVRLETWDARHPTGFPGPAPVSFRYWSFALARCQAEDYLKRSEPLAWALAALMRTERPPERLKLNCLQHILEAPMTPDRKYLLIDCVDAYLELNSQQERRFQAMLTERLDPEVLAFYQTETDWAKRLRANARTEGRREGMRQMMASILEQRFGKLPAATLRRLERIDVEHLEDLGRTALTAESLEDLGLR